MATPYKTFSNYTFGCKVNFADSSYIGRELIKYLNETLDSYSKINSLDLNLYQQNK